MLPRPLFLLVAILATALSMICFFYGLVAMVLPGPTALAVSCLLIALAMAYGIAVWLCLRCFDARPPSWLDGPRAALIAATLGLSAALPITIVGGYAANVAAVTLTAFLGGVIPVQIWLARRGLNRPEQDCAQPAKPE